MAKPRVKDACTQCNTPADEPVPVVTDMVVPPVLLDDMDMTEEELQAAPDEEDDKLKDGDYDPATEMETSDAKPRRQRTLFSEM